MNRRQFLTRTTAAAVSGLVLATTRSGIAAEAGDSDFCFCVIADPHTADGETKGLEKYGTGVDRLMTCVRMMEEMPQADRPDFILVAGDLHLDAFKECVPKVAIPMHVTPGNHESTKELRKLLRSLFPGDFKIDGKESDYYSFVHKGVRVISMCDAGMGGEHVGQLCSENITPSGQCEWLEKELAAPESKKILFAHIPTQRDGRDENMFLSRNDSRWFNKLVKETQPTALFFGHLHHPTEEYAVGATRVFQVRSCCWNFNQKPIGFLHVRVTPDGLTIRDIETGSYSG